MQLKQDIKVFLKKFDWKLLLIISLLVLIPTIYKTTRIFFIGQIDDGSSYSIAAQIQWLNIFYEIISEAIIVPLFFVLSRIKQQLEIDKNSKDVKNNFTLLSLIVFSFFLLFTIIIYFCLPSLVRNIGLNDNLLQAKTLHYMQFEVWSIFLTSVASFFIIAISILRMKWYLFVGILINLSYLVSNVLLDLFIVSNNSFSLKLEFRGAGISSIVSSFIFLTVSIIYFCTRETMMFNFNFKDFKWNSRKDLSLYFKNFLISGIETLVRNLIFSFMVLKSISSIGESGTYWIANSFIWTWLLIPISIVSLYIRETHSTIIVFEDKEKDKKFKTFFYFSLITIIVIIWCCFLPLNPIFINNVMGVTDYKTVNNLVLILFGFYVCYAYSSVIDSIFISNGRIGMFLIQTLIVNLTVYPIYYILYLTNNWIPSLESICIMFGIGLLVDFIVDAILLIIIEKANDPFKKLSIKVNNFIYKKILKKKQMDKNDALYKI